MSSVVKYKNKNSGVTYVYESTSYWDKDKKQSRSKRKCIGKLDGEGNIVPNRPKSASRSVSEQPCFNRLFYGATYLLDSIGDMLGITKDLKRCFPDTYKQILSLAYYFVMEDKNPLYRFEKWGLLHNHPYGEDIASQRSSELFALISADAQAEFFKLQAKRRIEKEYWAYDTTTISSYSETLKQVQHGKNKEHDKLPQLKLLLLFGEQSGLPFYYRKLAGNIPDSKTVHNLIDELNTLEYGKIKLVMDRGFYKEENINSFYKDHIKFLIGAKISLVLVRQALDSVYDKIRGFENYSANHDVYAYTVASEWNYTQARPYKNDELKEKRRIYVHLYYNIGKAAEDERRMDVLLSTLRDELLSGKLIEEHKKQYEQYFDVKQTPKRGISVMPRKASIDKAKRYYGYFALLTNEVMDAKTALELYRAKDVIEKAFGNLKERLDCRRALVSSEQTLDGKLFVEFVALIYLSYINKQMQEKSLYKHYTMHELLDKLDVIECFDHPGKALRIDEMTEKQHDIYVDLGVVPPK